MQILGLLSDFLLLGATAGIALWCGVLARRLRAFDDADSGLGGTVAALSRQVTALEASLETATRAAQARAAALDAALDAAALRADDRIGRMEMLLTTLETLEEEAAERLLNDGSDAARTHEPDEFEPDFRASRSHAARQTRGLR